jgi:hypothetical protein
VLDLQNDEVAKAWLEINQGAKAVIYFKKHDELVVCTRDQVVESFTASCFAQQLDQCVLYLDDAHTRGADVKLPRGFRTDTPPTGLHLYLPFHSCHSLKPFFRHHSSIRSATVFNISITQAYVFSRYSVKYEATPFSYRCPWS